MRYFFIGFPVLIVAYALAFQPSGAQVSPIGAEVEWAVIGDDDLPNGAPILAAAARIMPVCIQGPMHATPKCIYNSVLECRYDCRKKRSNPAAAGMAAGTFQHGQIKCFRNPAWTGPDPTKRRPGSPPSLITRP